MSNDFSTFFNELLNNITESSIALPEYIKVIDDNTQAGGALSITSDFSIGDDMNKLVSMLTSESSHTFNHSNTATDFLEEQLRNSLGKQSGGNKTNLNVDDVKKFFIDLKSQGVNVDVKLNDKSMTEFFGLADETTTELFSNATSVNMPNVQASATSANMIDMLSGGKGMSAGFKAFLDLKKFVADKLKIKNGKEAGVVAGAVQREVKEKYANIADDPSKVLSKAKEHFEENIERFKKML